MCVFSVRVCMWTTCMLDTSRSQKKGMGPLAPELREVMSHYGGARSSLGPLWEYQVRLTNHPCLQYTARALLIEMSRSHKHPVKWEAQGLSGLFLSLWLGAPSSVPQDDTSCGGSTEEGGHCCPARTRWSPLPISMSLLKICSWHSSVQDLALSLLSPPKLSAQSSKESWIQTWALAGIWPGQSALEVLLRLTSSVT